MNASPIHFVFDHGVRRRLRLTLRGIGRPDDVRLCDDNLAFGPIDPASNAARRRWLHREIGSPPEQWGSNWKDVSDFWRTALTTRRRRIVWFSRRTAYELAGFLEWIDRLGERAFRVVDYSDAAYEPDSRFAHLPAGELQRFVETEESLTATMRESYRREWRRLRAENAPLRVLGGDGLVSAGIDHYDPLLLSLVKTQSLKVARLMGEASLAAFAGQVNDFAARFFAARLRMLAESGKIVGIGNLNRPRFSEVRLRAA